MPMTASRFRKGACAAPGAGAADRWLLAQVLAQGPTVAPVPGPADAAEARSLVDVLDEAGRSRLGPDRGRGITLVARLSKDWGVRQLDVGKSVWAVVGCGAAEGCARLDRDGPHTHLE